MSLWISAATILLRSNDVKGRVIEAWEICVTQLGITMYGSANRVTDAPLTERIFEFQVYHRRFENTRVVN